MRFGTLTVVATLASSLILACDATGPDTDPQGQPGTVPSSLIAFFSAGDRSIYAVGPDGTGLHLIARGRPVRRSGNLSFSLPKWSPDGQNLAYLRYAGEDPGFTTLEVSDRDGSRSHAVSPSGPYIPEIAWAPHGDRLAFIRVTGEPGSSELYGGTLLYTVRKDGSEQRNIPTGNSGPVSLACPSWSPDGSRLAFVDQLNGLWTAGADGTDPQLVVSGAVLCARWSPDGTRLVFVNDRNIETSGADGWQEIYVVNLDGTGLKNLTPASAYDLEPLWSPDGSRIAFERVQGGDFALYQMRPDETEAVRVASDIGIALQMTWSPDGKQLAFVSGLTDQRDIEVVNADGTGRQNITHSALDEFEPDWR